MYILTSLHGEYVHTHILFTNRLKSRSQEKALYLHTFTDMCVHTCNDKYVRTCVLISIIGGYKCNYSVGENECFTKTRL